jgi:hypothetical protein
VRLSPNAGDYEKGHYFILNIDGLVYCWIYLLKLYKSHDPVLTESPRNDTFRLIYCDGLPSWVMDYSHQIKAVILKIDV